MEAICFGKRSDKAAYNVKSQADLILSIGLLVRGPGCVGIWVNTFHPPPRTLCRKCAPSCRKNALADGNGRTHRFVGLVEVTDLSLVSTRSLDDRRRAYS